MDRCTKTVAGIFGTFVLAAMLLVPCTVTRSTDTLDAERRIYIRKSLPERAYLFLPRYLSLKTRPRPGLEVRAHPRRWAGGAVLFALLGIADYAAFCRRRRDRRDRAQTKMPG